MQNFSLCIRFFFKLCFFKEKLAFLTPFYTVRLTFSLSVRPNFFTFLTSFILIAWSSKLYFFCPIVYINFKSKNIKWNNTWMDCRSLICIDVFVLIFSISRNNCFFSIAVSVSAHQVVLGVLAIKRDTSWKDFAAWRKYVHLNSVLKMVCHQYSFFSLRNEFRFNSFTVHKIVNP